MAGLLPVAAYALRIPPGDILIPAVPGFQATSHITMAAIDPSEEPEAEGSVDKQKPRATLKLVRVADDMFDDEEDSEDEEEDSEDEDEEEINGGPSSKRPSKKDILKALAEAEEEEDDEDMDEDSDDSEDDAAAEAVLAKLMKDAKKGKGKASEGEVEDSEEDDDDDESVEMDECVICTLDPEKAYQQPLDLVVAEGEKVFFKVSGNLTIHLTGNFVMPLDEPSEDEDEEDLEDYGDEELDALDALADGADESDELDDLEDPRVMEVDSEEEDTKPKAPPATTGKGKNKRPAEESAEEDVSLDNIMAKSLKKEESADTAESKKLSKAEKKKQKKLKNNEGEAAAAPQTNGTTPDSDKKKVQFAKNLEQGPTPSAKPDAKAEAKSETKTNVKADAKADAKSDSKKASVTLGVKTVSGVTVDDRKIGNGPAAKKGSRVEMRYIGKLKDGKVFDANKSGKPLSFKLGAGEVIKGWDIGIAGMSAGGERRLTVPAHLGYGKAKSGPIPANSELIFDVKCISVK